MTHRPATPDQPRPRLSRLDLHGFKSFATRTVFAFEPGITAVVGPNGSGKSNISDAVRWVLGETSSNTLRSKRTEDIIFAGGAGKAPTGMAEVTVTFNNEEGWLPSEFTEVTVTRRAFRGGDNQYFINGRRVRLKDVALLTASLGQSYTVVGQGLVDAALSQRADERRGLFEHAADLTGLRLKVAEAERSLDEADANTARLTDLLIELEPRLKTMARAARQAREWQGLRDRLTFLQRGHYRRRLRAAADRLDEADAVTRRDESALAGVRDTLERIEAERQSAREAAAIARDALAAHDARLNAIREQARRVGHERDLVRERQSALTRRREDMRDTQSGLDEQVVRVEAELAEVAAALTGITGEVDAARRALDALQAAARAGQAARSDLERQASDLARAIGQHENRIGALSQQRALIDQKRQTTFAERERTGREAKERVDRITSLERETIAFDNEDRQIAARITGLDAELARLHDAAAVQREQSAKTSANRAAIERGLGQATNRLDVLQKVHESGTGLHAGVRQVMGWRSDGSLGGIRGPVAGLIAVAATYDTAVEVALGGHLQDIVVDRWADAEAAIVRLKASQAGRATFQPLDTVDHQNAGRPAPAQVLVADGVHGVAADLVTADEDIAGVVRALLGRIVVVADLPTARRILSDVPAGWSAVTLAGEIARSGGSVTGGSTVRESGVLSRKRDLRKLPGEVRSLEADLSTARANEAAITVESGAIAARRGELETDRAGLIAQRRERAGQRDRLAGWLHDLRAEQTGAARQVTCAEETGAAHEAEIVRIGEERAALVAAANGLREQHERIVGELDAHRAAAATDDEARTAAQRDVAALEERERAERRRDTSLVAQRASLSEEMTHRAERVAEFDGERAALDGQHERLEREVASLMSAETETSGARGPLVTAVAARERGVRELDERIEATRRDLLDRERQLGQHGLMVERARSELTAIRHRISDDLGLPAPDDLLVDLSDHPISDDESSPLPTLDDDYEAVEREIGRLRDRLRRVGYVGDDVVADFERETEHHEFLRTQLDDVRGASAALRKMLAELHSTMHERFEETFSKVAVAFGEAFTTLFGGGTARLVLTRADDDGDGAAAASGIDIVAQPPGKRLQNLSLLSGGERSLTAVALLFAILRVNPSPFVLLDEVDAALDEANVVRFRDELRKLASETQAIVITHNRGTVEIADTLYGVTMGGDGVSQVLSLRLGDLPLDDEIDIRDLPSLAAGVPTR